jgi:hypothetical protein
MLALQMFSATPYGPIIAGYRNEIAERTGHSFLL